ncbi:MAG: hypothetical protein PVF43_11155 [Candidatus Eiseniibacteriota bacterium]|jgi:hypothetical protein
MKLCRALLLALAAGGIAAPALAFDDFQTWSEASFRYLKRDRLSLGVGAELRLNDDSTFPVFTRVSHLARWRPGERWTFDGNLSYILLRVEDVSRIDTLRLELTATPRWKTGERSTFELRNRVDLWWREGNADEETVLRLRPHFVLNLDDDGRRKLWFGGEALYSESLERLFQHRVHLIGASLPVGRRVRVDLYAMVFSLRVGDDWRHDLVLGQSWIF